MNQLGVHMLVFGEEWDEAHARSSFERAASAGFDLIEVLIDDPAKTDSAMTARLSEETGVGVIAAMCGTLEANISHPDPGVREMGEQRISDGLRVARDMGASMLAGPTFSPLYRYDSPLDRSSREAAVEIYGRLAERAVSSGLCLGLEALNRYESNVLNTIAETAALCRAIGSPALFTHADIFHMNIEERDLGDAIRAAGDTIGYIHVTESNRGPVGTGNIDWSAFFTALAAIRYNGPLTFESFSPSVLGPELCDMLALWRNPWTDPDEVAKDAAIFLRTGLGGMQITSSTS